MNNNQPFRFPERDSHHSFFPYDSIYNYQPPERLAKMLNYMSMGFNADDADKMCKSDEISFDDLKPVLMERQEKEYRKLARLNPRPKKPKRSKYIFKDEIVVSDVDLKSCQESKYMNSEDQKCI
jgi:hypothetical protein